MDTELDQIIDSIAADLARQSGEPLATLKPRVHTAVVAARVRYRARGAPLGDNAPRFVLWLLDHRLQSLDSPSHRSHHR